MPKLWISEDHHRVMENKTLALIGSVEAYETRHETPGELYRDLQREGYGRSVSKIFVDKADGTSQAVGWVFVKRKPFDDDKSKSYLHETWVTVYTAPPQRHVTLHHADIEKPVAP